MLRRIPTGVYLSIVIAIGLIAVNIPAFVLYVDKHEGTGEDFIYNGCLGDYTLPSSTLQDIVTYADQLSVIRVVSERFIDQPEEGRDPDGSYTIRVITIGVEETLWRREGAPVAEPEFETIAFKSPDTGRKFITGDTRFEVGVRYIAPLTRFANTSSVLAGGGAWGPISNCLVLPLDGDVVALPEFTTYTRPEELAGQLVGMSVYDYAAIIGGTSPADATTD